MTESLTPFFIILNIYCLIPFVAVLLASFLLAFNARYIFTLSLYLLTNIIAITVFMSFCHSATLLYFDGAASIVIFLACLSLFSTSMMAIVKCFHMAVAPSLVAVVFSGIMIYLSIFSLIYTVGLTLWQQDDVAASFYYAIFIIAGTLLYYSCLLRWTTFRNRIDVSPVRVTSNLNAWLLLGVGIAYPVLLLARLFLVQQPPTWMLDTSPALFLIIILPALAGTVVVVAKLNGAQITWVAALALTIWIALISFLYLYFLVQIVVTA